MVEVCSGAGGSKMFSVEHVVVKNACELSRLRFNGKHQVKKPHGPHRFSLRIVATTLSFGVSSSHI